MKTALVIGATGLTGKKITRLILADKRYTIVKLLVRTPMDFIHEKLEQITFDFEHPDISVLKADEVFCCLGTTIKNAGSKEAFRKVDFYYVVGMARLCKQQGATKFAFISSLGANKNSSVFYNKVKGETEEALKDIGFDGCIILRPSLLVGTRKEFRPKEDATKFFLSIFSIFLPKKYRPIHSRIVAAAMLYLMNENLPRFKIFESDDIAELPVLV